jgi:hypothetical protein
LSDFGEAFVITVTVRPLLILASVVLVGCSTFQPSALESVRPGGEIRAHLTNLGEDRVEEFMPRTSRGGIVGTLLRADADSVVVEVWRTDLMGSRVFQPGRIRIPMATGEVLGIDERRFAALRTAALTAGIALAAFGLFDGLLGGRGAGAVERGGDPQISLLRLWNGR